VSVDAVDAITEIRFELGNLSRAHGGSNFAAMSRCADRIGHLADVLARASWEEHTIRCDAAGFSPYDIEVQEATP
jgi:hypothetical protein